MKTSDNIVHKGLVKSVSDGVAYISFQQEGGCSSCTAKSACSMTKTSEHLLRLPVTDAPVTPGEEVVVSITASNGYRAVMLSYLVPVIILLTVLLLAVASGIPEHLAGLSAISALVPWFVLLHLARRFFKNKVTYEVLKR